MRNLLIPTDGPPTSAGEMLVEEFLRPLGISQTDFAQRIGVTFHRLNEIVNGRRGISIDAALRSSKALGTTPDFWLNLQRINDIYDAMRAPLATQIAKIKPIVRPDLVDNAKSRSSKPRKKRNAPVV